MTENPEDELDTLTVGPTSADWTLILAHGAGQGMDSPFMTHVAGALGRAGIGIGRFEFPYMIEMRRTGRRAPPNREPVLLQHWNLVIDRELAAGTDPRRLLIGGKSLGGRMASLIADERGVAGLLCLGYLFHPPGRPDCLRTEHLRVLHAPTLSCQGARDPFGKPEEVAEYALAVPSTSARSAAGITVTSHASDPAILGNRIRTRRRKRLSSSSARCKRVVGEEVVSLRRRFASTSCPTCGIIVSGAMRSDFEERMRCSRKSGQCGC